jgi:uncharacterized membrane protein YphA (DoxX/SURF4 family)
MFEQSSLPERRNALGDWILRGSIAAAYCLLGSEKFGANSQWVVMFQQIGVGQWFRYFTGVVEILGGVLLLTPWTVTAGLALLASTMASAALILAFVLGRPGDSIFPGIFFLALGAFWWNRRGK